MKEKIYNLLKVKSFFDAEAIVVKHNPVLANTREDLDLFNVKWNLVKFSE